jgi:hypothetical protein
LRKARTIASFLVVAVISFSLLFIPAFAARDSVQVTRLANPVAIDGKWTTADEWSDTNRVSMNVVQGPASTGHVRLKHDSDFLYLLADFVSDTTSAIEQTGTSGSAYDHFAMGIDEDVNDTNTKCCDMMVDLAWYNKKPAPDPVQPPWVQGSMSYNATYDPDSSKPHAIYEIAVPMAVFEKNSAVRISVWDYSRGVNMHWPSYKGSWSMSYFGDIVFSELVVPEFPLGATVLLAAVVLGAALMTRRKWCLEMKATVSS